MSSYLDGRVVVITGAGGGFGRLLAEGAAQRGAHVVAADIDSDSLDSTAALSDRIIGVVADVTERQQMHELAAAAVEHFGAIDVMINNAGIMPLAFFADHHQAAEAWDRCIDINLKGVINGITAVYDQMIEQRRGHIVNISSIYGNQPVVGSAVYGATKSAVAFVSDALRQEAAGTIKVTTVRPTGIPNTGLMSGVLNPQAVAGIFGTKAADYFARVAEPRPDTEPDGPPGPDSPTYSPLVPNDLTEQVLWAIDQPWGVTISDVTVRATGDPFAI